MVLKRRVETNSRTNQPLQIKPTPIIHVYLSYTWRGRHSKLEEMYVVRANGRLDVIPRIELGQVEFRVFVHQESNRR
jgi:hypothetical protein